MKKIYAMMKVELAEYSVQIWFNAHSDYCIKRFSFCGVKYIPRKRLVSVQYFMQRHCTDVLHKGRLKIQIKICYLLKPKVFFFFFETGWNYYFEHYINVGYGFVWQISVMLCIFFIRWFFTYLSLKKGL